MTVKQLIDKLKEFPENMPVATWKLITLSDVSDPEFVGVSILDCECEDEIFQYVNIE